MGDVRDGGEADTELARRATGGDGEAFSLLFDRWFDRAFDVAWHIVHQRELAADVVQDAFATAWSQIGNLRQPESFGGWLLRITRNKALNKLKREQRSRPLGDEDTLVSLDPRQSDEPQRHVDEQDYGDLVWAASAALGEDDASLLSLHLRHGLEAAELAEELGLQPNAAHQRLFRLRKRLADAIGAWVLWHKGQPACQELTAALGRADVAGFDSQTARTISRHAKGCKDCDKRRSLRLQPEALFASVPLVLAGTFWRTKAVAALSAQDVPVPRDGAGRSDLGSSGDTDSSDSDDPNDTDSSDSEPSSDTDSAATDEPEPEPVEIANRASHDRRAPSWRRPLIGAGIGVALLLGALLAVGIWASPLGNDDTTLATADPATDAETSDSSETDATSSTGDSPSSSGSTSDPTSSDPPGSSEPTNPPGSGPASGSNSTDSVATGPGTTNDPSLPSSGDGTQPPPADDPTTTPPSDPEREEPPPPPPEPTIGGFRATRADGSCRDATTVPMTFVWQTSNATKVTLGPAGGPAEEMASPQQGSETRCATSGTWVLTATGPGGTVSDRLTVPQPSRSPGDLTS